MTGHKKASGATEGAPENDSDQHKGQGGGAALQRFFSDADKYLQDAPLAQQAAALTGLRPSVLVAGLGVFMVVSLGTGFGGGLVCDIAGFLYPAWMSFRAIESQGAEDDKLWLTYWVVYGAFSIAEYFVDIILFWVPFYYLFKFCFLLYLALPCFKGAEVVYNVLIRPFLLEHQKPIDAYMDKLGEAGSKAAEGLHQAVHDSLNKVNQAVNIAQSLRTPQREVAEASKGSLDTFLLNSGKSGSKED